MIKLVIIINKVSFLLLLFNNTTIPNPAFINSPDTNAPKDKLFKTNNSTIITEEAQLGINPIIVANRGAKYLLEIKK